MRKSSYEFTCFIDKIESFYVGIIFKNGLFTNTLPSRDKSKVISYLNQKYDFVIQKGNNSFISEIIVDMWKGKDVSKEADKIKIDYTGFNQKQISILQFTRSIEFGYVKSYTDVALNVGLVKSQRYIGHILSQNRWPLLIPCHRVIRKDGKIGKYSFISFDEINDDDERSLKLHLLSLEGY